MDKYVKLDPDNWRHVDHDTGELKKVLRTDVTHKRKTLEFHFRSGLDIKDVLDTLEVGHWDADVDTKSMKNFIAALRRLRRQKMFLEVDTVANMDQNILIRRGSKEPYRTKWCWVADVEGRSDD